MLNPRGGAEKLYLNAIILLIFFGGVRMYLYILNGKGETGNT